tara:strand:- start:1662 stop:2489 length:828 start_codon:yes stop_codon:yes gene_type:complete
MSNNTTRSVLPLYAKFTGKGEIPNSSRHVKGFALTSQYKVSLGIDFSYNSGDNNLGEYLRECGVVMERGDVKAFDFYASDATLPGATFDMSEEMGGRQGTIERVGTRRIYAPLSVTFYVDENYKIIRLFEEWMNFMNPIHNNQGKYGGDPQGQRNYRDRNNYYKFRYPDQYKRNIVVTKFDKAFYGDANLSFTSRLNRGNPNDTQIGENFTPQEILCFDFIDCFPSNLVAMPLSYEGSSLTKVTVEFQYLRYNTITNSMSSLLIPFTENFFGNQG